MRMTRLHAPTLKEVPKDAEVVSHQLLVRGGYIRKLAAGIYDYLPLAQRVLNKIRAIIREEMDRAGAQEVFLPAVQPAEVWQESGRWAKYGPELLRMKDRKGGEFCLGPTHEEVIVDVVRRDVRSWRALPLNLSAFGLDPTCELLNSADSTVLFGVAGGNGTFSLAIPNNAAFNGIYAYFQVGSIDAGATGGFAVSNGLAGRLGDT